MAVELQFCGAAGVVTGSSYLLRLADGQQGLVDCGLFQGTKTLRALNYADFPFDPAALSFVLLTHAHIDHSGLLPKLFRQGFAGKVYTSAATRDLLQYMLHDSAHIQESEVARLNVRNAHRGLPGIEPIYTRDDVETCLNSIEIVSFNGWHDVAGGVKMRLWNAGHILGSASIELQVPDGKGAMIGILFSGDIGPQNKMFHPKPESPHDIDYVVTESTYGSRTRDNDGIDARRARLQEEVMAAMEAGGNILIPSFAVERTQELLLDLDWLAEHSRIPGVSIFIDSPLATQVTGVFEKHKAELEDLTGDVSPFKGRNVYYVRDVQESKALNRIRGGAIIMAGSGMCDAGRIRHHLKNNLWDKNCTVLFVGYQAEGTLGKLIQDGHKKVRISGDEVIVKARIRSIDTYSAHADQSELLNWIAARKPVRKNIFLTHGSDESRMALRAKMGEKGIDTASVLMPELDAVYRLDTNGGAILSDQPIVPRLVAEDVTAKTDWHNDYAGFVLGLADYLRGLKNNKARRDVLADLFRRIDPEGDV